MKNFAAPLIGLSLFMVISLTLTWLVHETLVPQRHWRHDTLCGGVHPMCSARGRRRPYRGSPGGPCREHRSRRTHAKVDFVAERPEAVATRLRPSPTRTSWAALSRLSQGKTGDPAQLQAGAVIPRRAKLDRSDVGAVINGFEPLFTTIDPKDLNNLTQGAINPFRATTSPWRA